MTQPADALRDVAPSTVGVIVNPHAGKDIRRLVSAAGHTSDTVKIGILRRVVAGALEQGAERILMSLDSHRLGQRAVAGLDDAEQRVEFVEGPGTGSHLDTVAAAQAMWKRGSGAVVCLGGDGTCRDVATGWPEVPLIAISTGTNNVFPATIDGTTAGVAAALVAQDATLSGGDTADLLRASKRVVVEIDDPSSDALVEEVALVEAALVDTAFVGARAVGDPASIRWVVAGIADPATTGVSSIAGRIHPVSRHEDSAVLLRLGPGGRRVRVPLAPGTFATLEVAEVQPIALGDAVELPGGGVVAYDGERTTTTSAAATVRVSVDRSGPRVVDVTATLHRAARAHMFDAPDDPADRPNPTSQGKDPDAH